MDLINSIKRNESIRESLIRLKASSQCDSLLQKDQQFKQKLIEFLSHEDPKVRKNSAILLGKYANTVNILLDAYDQEQTEYVKEAYLTGIAQQDCRAYIQRLKDIQNQLIHASEMTKHIQAQLKILNPLILKNQVHKRKIIKIKHEPVDVVLTSLPYYQFVLFESVLHLKYKPVTQGVLVRTDSLYDLLNIRTYHDMLIPLAGATGLNIDLDSIMAGFQRCHLETILDKLYDDHSFEVKLAYL